MKLLAERGKVPGKSANRNRRALTMLKRAVVAILSLFRVVIYSIFYMIYPQILNNCRTTEFVMLP